MLNAGFNRSDGLLGFNRIDCVSEAVSPITASARVMEAPSAPRARDVALGRGQAAIEARDVRFKRGQCGARVARDVQRFILWIKPSNPKPAPKPRVALEVAVVPQVPGPSCASSKACIASVCASYASWIASGSSRTSTPTALTRDSTLWLTCSA